MKRIFSKKNGKRLLQAIVTSYVLYYVISYILNGELEGPLKMLSVEFIFVALYITVTFFILTYISSRFNKLSAKNEQIWWIRFLELILVIVVGILLNYLLFVLPTILRHGQEIMLKQPDGRSRLIYSLHLIVVLCYYYFVERINTQSRLKDFELKSERLLKENTEAQLLALKNQINPHFLFNSFNILNSLIELDPDRAKQFLEKLSNIYRVFLENINESLIPLNKEIEVMESYSALLQTRFQNHLNIDINLKENNSNWLVPPGVSQMLMENAIKHNGFNKNKPLIIEIYKEGEFLVVKNNKQVRNEPSTSTGIGLRNIKARYELQGNQELLIENTDQFFTVKVPLLKPQAS
ncbi:MAG: sensor histidine kinase [Bacteroidota bacterium]